MTSSSTMQTASEFGKDLNFVQDSAELTEFILSYFTKDELRGKKILDLGCRTGEMVALLNKLGAYATGLDIDQNCIQFAKQSYPEIQDSFFVGDIRDLSRFKSESFDLVICIGVICYVPPTEWIRTLHGFANVCDKNGKILVLFQKSKPAIVEWIVKLISLIPSAFYIKVLCPIGSAILAPVSGILFGKKLSASEIHYRIMMSLRGLHFGYPKQLEPYLVETKNTGVASAATSASFVLSQTQCNNLS